MSKSIYKEGENTVVLTDNESLNGRFNVAKYVKGGKNCNKAENWTIYDINRKRYMQIIPDSVSEIKAFGLIRKLI